MMEKVSYFCYLESVEINEKKKKNLKKKNEDKMDEDKDNKQTNLPNNSLITSQVINDDHILLVVSY